MGNVIQDLIGLVEQKIDVAFDSANLYFNGIAMDSNGNKVAKFSFPNQPAFSIQTNQNLPSLHGLSKTDKELSPAMEKEVIAYIQKFGSPKQKSSLKVYSK